MILCERFSKIPPPHHYTITITQPLPQSASQPHHTSYVSITHLQNLLHRPTLHYEYYHYTTTLQQPARFHVLLLQHHTDNSIHHQQCNCYTKVFVNIKVSLLVNILKILASCSVNIPASVRRFQYPRQETLT